MVGYIIGRILIGLFLLLAIGGIGTVIILFFKYIAPTPEEQRKQEDREHARKRQAQEDAKKRIAKQPVEVKVTETMLEKIISQHKKNPLINNPVTITTAERIAEALYLNVCLVLSRTDTTSPDISFSRCLKISTLEVKGDFSISNAAVYNDIKKYGTALYADGIFINFNSENLDPIKNSDLLKLFADALVILSKELFITEYQKNSIVCTIQDYDLSFKKESVYSGMGINLYIQFKAANPNYVNNIKEWI